MNAGAVMQDTQSPRTAMRRVARAAAKAVVAVTAVLVFGVASSTPSLADPGEHGRGHAWGHYKKHHHDEGPVVIYGAPPSVVVVPAPPPRVVYAPSYAPPPVIYAPAPPQPGVSVQMNIPLR
jgi:hypothetical protein